jgi:hypothetical protein
VEIEATADAVEFITEHGGNLYVWADEVGLEHASPKQPGGDHEFTEYPAEGFTFHLDTSVGEPDWWKIEFHHFPHKHVTALWDGGSFGGPTLF